MDDDTHELMTVGRFAAASGLTARALRLYDAAGLLQPAETDEVSGYRRYGLRQLGRARLIRLLRDGDVPLELVASVLDASVDAQVRRLDEHQRFLEAEHASRLAALAETREMLTGKGDAGAGPVRLIDVPDLAYLGTRKRVALTDLPGFIEAGIAEHADEADGAPFVIFHAPVVNDTGGDVEVCVPVRHHERAATLSRHRALSIEATGQAARFPDVLRAYERLAVTAYVRGLQLAGPPREEYRGHLTQILWPVTDA